MVPWADLCRLPRLLALAGIRVGVRFGRAGDQEAQRADRRRGHHRGGVRPGQPGPPPFPSLRHPRTLSTPSWTCVTSLVAHGMGVVGARMMFGRCCAVLTRRERSWWTSTRRWSSTPSRTTPTPSKSAPTSACALVSDYACAVPVATA
eukprot:2519358-Rhodomonas_salina.2